MSTPKRSLTFSAQLDGTVNGQPIALVGEGQIERGLGLTKGTYSLKTLPEGFHPLLLSSFLITGYPNASASVGNTPNLFRDRSYDYRRVLKLRDGGELAFRARCVLEGDHITSRFYMTGHASVPPLLGVEPLVESWEPNGPGGVRGHFTISWRAKGGALVTGDAMTSYQIETEDVQQGLLHRFVQMNASVRGTTLTKIQSVGLFQELPKSLWIDDPSDVKRIDAML